MSDEQLLRPETVPRLTETAEHHRLGLRIAQPAQPLEALDWPQQLGGARAHLRPRRVATGVSRGERGDGGEWAGGVSVNRRSSHLSNRCLQLTLMLLKVKDTSVMLREGGTPGGSNLGSSSVTGRSRGPPGRGASR